jgi:hypothetical protein
MGRFLNSRITGGPGETFQRKGSCMHMRGKRKLWKASRTHCTVVTRKEGREMIPTHNQVVVHFADGRLVKGQTRDFFPDKETFHVSRVSPAGVEGTEEIQVACCKAVFFVKGLLGDARYEEKKSFDEVPGSGKSGIKIKVEFEDGETIRGISMGYNRTRKGFFVIPVDPKSNNERIYVVVANAARVTVGPDAEK